MTQHIIQNYQPYDGDIYDYGEEIPDYVDNIYTPHVWYDQSRRYKSNTDVFDELMVSQTLLLGESEDDMWGVEDILKEILQYLNLHIVQEGYDYYIFDWETARTNTQVTWLDIFTGDTFTGNYSIVNVAPTMFGSNDTQLTMADVYNQISVKDDITKMDDVLFSPFDSDQLSDITAPQKYMIEYAAPGEGNDALAAFYYMMHGFLPETDYGKDSGDSAYKKKWMMKLKKSAYWDFLKNGISIYNNIDVDGNGKYCNQWKLPKYIDSTPFASGILSFASGDEYNKQNSQDLQNITKFDDYICINIGGNGADEKSVQTKQQKNINEPVPTIFPRENDIKNSGMEIKYSYSTDGTYSSADESIKNYLVFSGQILMTTARQTTGNSGFQVTIPGIARDVLNNITSDANNPNKGGNYVDWAVFKRKDNTYSQVYNLSTTDLVMKKYYTVPSPKNDDGAYYTLLFYKNEYPNTDYEDYTLTNVLPPLDRGALAKRFKYSTEKHSYNYDANNGTYDIISYVDILACQLRIGDKFCEEYITTETIEGIEHAYKNYRWVTTEELMDRPNGSGYDLLSDGTIRYKAYINLAVDIDEGQFLIGDNLDFYNNIVTEMGLEKTGIAIPLPYEDNLSGDLEFSIIGPVNLTWDNGIRRHSTWFRSGSTTENSISVMPHVDKIWIKKFGVDLVSDRGKNVEYKDADIVYKSAMQKKFINTKDDIDFKFTTALTAAEAEAMKVNLTVNRSDITDSTGAPILGVTNVFTSETDKPEKIYVDAYYNEYCEPRTIMESSLHDTSNVNIFNKYNFGFMNGKTYYVMGEKKDLKSGLTKIKFKERIQ